MALLIGGGFLISQKVETAQAIETYTPVYTQDFGSNADISSWTRATVSGTTATWGVDGGVLKQAGGSGWSNTSLFLRPANENIADGKASTTTTTRTYGGCVIARYNATTGEFYYFCAGDPGSSSIKVVRATKNDSSLIDGGLTIIGEMNSTITWEDNVAYRLELEVLDVAANNTKITANVYNQTDTLLTSKTYTDTGANLPAGQWGIYTIYGQVQFKDFKLYDFSNATDLTITGSASNVGKGKPITYTLTDDEAQTVTFTDNGEGGTFSPSNTVTLTGTGTTYTATVTYTPARTGALVINAASPALGVDFQDDIFVSPTPYSQVIGFIGDSITNQGGGIGAAVGSFNDTLGADFHTVNRGVSGTKTATWVNDEFSTFTNAIAAFQAEDVDVVHIMLGTNDSLQDVAPADYKVNMQVIIDRLRTAGISKVILSYPIYNSGVNNGRLAGYYAALNELVSENSDIALLGDTDGATWFEQNPDGLADGAHPTAAGYTKLGQLWATAFRRVVTEPLTTAHQFVGGGNYVLGSSVGLKYSVAKDFAWFNVGAGNFANVLVDGVIVDSANYSAVSGSTVITLSPAYLDTLTVGSHNLTVRFTDGVSFTSAFTVAAKGGGTTPPIIPGAPNTGLFGTSAETTVAGFGLLTVAAALGAVLLGRKLALNRK